VVFYIRLQYGAILNGHDLNMLTNRFLNVAVRKVIEKVLLLSSAINGNSDSALAALLRVYEQRPDLQEVYPEVRAGNHARLIDWAAGVSQKTWKDSSFPALRKHTAWYSAHFTAAAPAITWESVEEASALSANPLKLSLRVMRDKSAADISDHLITLSLLVREFGLKNIVELGVRTGNSTLVLLEAARQIGGRVLSVDVEPCLEARERIAKAHLADHWRFVHGNDLEVADSEIPNPIDFLFIDTNHLYDCTIAEFKKYSLHLRNGSWIALHDYVSFPGVARATGEFLASLPQKAHFFPFVHQNGLALIRNVS
jgi:predicted O-methyltransferase YrrM